MIENKIEAELDINFYRRLKKIMDDKETEEFRERYSSHFYIGFYISMLVNDGLFEKILDFAKKWNKGVNDFDKVISPIAARYPVECLQIAGNIILNDLDKHQGRELYANVAEVLDILAKGTPNNSAVKQFAASLVKKFYRRSALKEELKNKNLI